MNQSIKYSPDGYYNVKTGNIRTVGEDTVEIDHVLILGDLPDDVGNPNLITADNIGRLYKLPKSSLPPINPFDQDLNTTDSVEFADITLSNVQIDNLQNKLLVLNSTTFEVEYRDVSSLPVENPFDQNLNTTDTAEFQKISIKNANFDPSVDTDMCINSTAVASLNLDASGSPYPYFTISDRVVNGAGTSLGFGFYRGPNGVARASDTNFVEIAKAHGGNRLFIAGSTVPQVPGTVLNNVASIATLGVDDIVIGVPLKMNSVVINNTQNKLLVLNSATSIVEYRDVSSLPGGDVDGPILSTDNAIARFDNTTGKIIQNSSVIVDDGGGITTSGIINCFTPTFDIEFDTDFVIVKQGNDILKKVLRADLFGQNLTTAGVVRFNTVTTPTLQTDTIVENTVNGGVKVGAWDLKTQKITSDALVSVTDPLTISLKYFGDANSSLSLYAENHDNNGLLFDMNHVPLGGTNDFLSGSVNGNVFINKNVDALDFLFQNGIAKGSSVNKLAMVKTMSLTKTSINLTQTVNVGQSLICDNLTTDDNTNIYFLTQKDSTNEVMKRDYQPTYGSLGITGNLVATVINTVDVYEILSFIGSTAPLKKTVQTTTTLTPNTSGVYEITYNLAIRPDVLATTKLWETAVFVNGSTITASVMCIQTTDADELGMISNSFMYSHTSGEVLDIRIRNRTNDTNVILECGNFTIKRMID